MIDIGSVTIKDAKVTQKDLNNGRKPMDLTGDVFARQVNTLTSSPDEIINISRAAFFDNESPKIN